MRGERWARTKTGGGILTPRVRIRVERARREGETFASNEAEFERVSKLAAAAPELLDALEDLVKFALRAVNDEPYALAAKRVLEAQATSVGALVIGLRAQESDRAQG